jgi:hypothetical protein
MLCKVACRTPVGWFFWEDQLFSTQEKAFECISKQKDYIRKDLFLVYPNYMEGWGR